MKAVAAGALSVVVLVLAAAAFATGAAQEAARSTADTRPGGDTTVDALGHEAFSLPAANLADAERARFSIGNSFFRRNWVQAPASARARDGLGPFFHARSCSGCHPSDGRGEPFAPGADSPSAALLFRLSVPGNGPQGGPLPEPVYGDQLSPLAVPGVPAEGQVQVAWQALHGRFADGTPYVLQQPRYTPQGLAYGPLAPGAMLGPRLAPQLIGVGLLEAIADEDIEANARQQARRDDGIRGQVNRVWDAPSQRQRVGRFGWKANTATLLHQSAAAFAGDMGITSTWFPDEACSEVQAACRRAPHGAQGRGPEIDDTTLGHVVFYEAVLAPPARREADDAQVRAGERLFVQARCAACHRPAYVTGAPPFPALSSAALQGQAIRPYTDLLLHDMGEGLADGRPDFGASGRQWKTPPLWGIGLLRTVNGHQRLLHDGRADGVLQAVLWHGGEAQISRDAVLRMTAAEREALVRFVESL